MNKETALHEEDYIRIYEDKGYTTNFRFEKGKLVSDSLNHTYSSKEIEIIAKHRFVGMSEPYGVSVLCIIESDKGEKGTFLVDFDSTDKVEIGNFFNITSDEDVFHKKNTGK